MARWWNDYYDHAAADRDLNCVFPIERLRELADGGEIDGLGARHVGLMAICSRPSAGGSDTRPRRRRRT